MESEKNMTILDHLDELRKRLTIIAAVNILTAVALFGQTDKIMAYLLAVNPGLELVYITPSELLTVYIKIAFIIAIVICSPVTIYQIWAFVEKGLYKSEKVYISIALVFAVALFIIGVLFCYFMVLPTTLDFFLRIAIEEVSSKISIDSYVSFVNTMLLSFGAVFELPVLVFLLTKLGVIKPELLKKNRGLIIVVIFILAAFITPPDVISQIMLGIPLVLLMEVSIVISSLVVKFSGKKADESEKDTEDDQEVDQDK